MINTPIDPDLLSDRQTAKATTDTDYFPRCTHRFALMRLNVMRSKFSREGKRHPALAGAFMWVTVTFAYFDPDTHAGSSAPLGRTNTLCTGWVLKELDP